MKTDTLQDALSLENVDGLGSAGIKALNQEGFFNTLQVIHKNPVWLKDVTGMDKDKAGEAFAFMRKNLISAGLLSPQEMSCTELLQRRKTIKRIQTGCRGIDHLLNGGFECGSITEMYGENGAGKTQMTHNMCIQVQFPIDEGGLAEAGQAPPLILYLDTENTFRPERIKSILVGKKLIRGYPDELKKKIINRNILNSDEIKLKGIIESEQEKQAERYMDNIIVNRVSDAYAQCTKIKDTIRMMEAVPIKLIIVDSGTALFRGSFLGRGNLKGKFDLMNEMVHDLLAIAENHKIVVLFVNQIYNAPEEQYGQDPDEPYGGNVIGHSIPYRLKLEKSGNKHKLKIIKSPYQANDDVRFDITEAGISDIVA